jgi:hypothetical protein
MVKRDEEKEAIRITQQFRSGESMIYDFRGETGRLTLRVSGRGGDDAGPPAEWHVEARTGSSLESVVSAEWAPTRAEALRAAGRAWNSKCVAKQLPAIDWESVALAMSAVRAL